MNALRTLKQKHLGWLRYALTLLLAAALLAAGNRVVSRDLQIFKHGNAKVGVPTRVTAITGRGTEEGGLGVEMWVIHFEGVVTSGEFKGLEIEGRQLEDPYLAVPMKEVATGDRVLLYEYKREEDGSTIWAMQEYIRSNALIGLGLFFVLLLLVFGRWKGLNTVISLAFTCLAIFAVLIPAILNGYPVYAVSAAVCLSIILMTLVMVNGYNRKSLSAGIGCVGGLAACGMLLVVMNRFLRLTGLVDEESAYLLYINPENPLDLKAITFCAIVLGALGATLDVSVSIASSLSEIEEAGGERQGFGAVLRSGMNIGRDIMGTMANTLVLAYIGSSMSLVLLLIVYSNSPLELFNREVVVVEILQSLVGSIGLLASIPITSLAWGMLTAGRSAPAAGDVTEDGMEESEA